MIEYLIVLCDTNHENYTVKRLHASDIDKAAVAAIEQFGGRMIVKGVVEYVDGEVGETMQALAKELS